MECERLWIQSVNREKALIFFLVEGKYPMWPLFVKADCGDCSAECRGLQTAYNTVRNLIAEFFYFLRNTYQLLYYSIRNDDVSISSKVSSGSLILGNMMIRLEEIRTVFVTERSENIIQRRSRFYIKRCRKKTLKRDLGLDVNRKLP